MIFLLVIIVVLLTAAVIAVLPEFIGPRLSVLIYHRIAPDADEAYDDLLYTVNESAFAEQMRYLGGGGVDVWGIGEIEAYFNGRLKLKRRTVAVTFDDGFQSLLTRGLPILKRNKVPAILFASPYPYKHLFEDKADPILSPAELRELSQNGVSVQSHTLTHRPLSELRDEEVVAEFRYSKLELEHITGEEVISLGIPGNFYRRRLNEFLLREGYRLCFSADKGTNGVFDRDRLHVRRLIVERETNLKTLLTPAGAVRARFLGILKKLPLAYFTPKRWEEIRGKIFSLPGIRPLLTSKGLTLLGGGFFLVLVVAILLGFLL
ncbi:hypothetical protein CEE36_07365 [candidate division TA06 bacterium B3_TA06]|uniref:NodB homology domain-containing protein n=1 Tax=candidate division TA06 bacterium B3_TA06 TaxID=2012487 RepID=A0A532V4A7_UNCT6|nr:MAG: hypothetical protein CEE36_07365 [candidate division TA06 bacterium B3_TA06]